MKKFSAICGKREVTGVQKQNTRKTFVSERMEMAGYREKYTARNVVI
jgi:hypothetical protein